MQTIIFRPAYNGLLNLTGKSSGQPLVKSPRLQANGVRRVQGRAISKPTAKALDKALNSLHPMVSDSAWENYICGGDEPIAKLICAIEDVINDDNLNPED